MRSRCFLLGVALECTCMRVAFFAHACSFLCCGYQEDYRMHLTLCNPTVHNDMKLDKYKYKASVGEGQRDLHVRRHALEPPQGRHDADRDGAAFGFAFSRQAPSTCGGARFGGDGPNLCPPNGVGG